MDNYFFALSGAIAQSKGSLPALSASTTAFGLRSARKNKMNFCYPSLALKHEKQSIVLG
jgi:hypothetical protein